MRRRVLLTSLLLAGLLAALLAREVLREPRARDAVSDEQGGGRKDPASDAVLVGAGVPVSPVAPVDRLADETDVEVLVRQAWIGSPAQRRLLELARADAAVLAELVDWLRPEHDHERMPAARQGQQYSGPTGSPALASLADTLAQLAPASVPLLVAALEDEDPVFRERVVQVLGRLPAHARDVVPALVVRLGKDGDEGDVGAQVAILRALGALGPGASDAAEVLLAYVRDDAYADDARAAAAESLFGVVGPTPAALEAAAWALRDQSFEVCTRLIPDLAALGSEASAVVPDLLGILLDPTANDGVQDLALDALGRIGSRDEAVGDALLALALDEDEEEWLRGSALTALGRLGGDAVGSLLKQLSSAGPDTRCLAVRALAEVETVAPSALLALLESLRKSKWPEERWQALRAGARVQGESDLLVPWLARWMEDDTLGMRAWVLQRATRLADDSGRVVDLLASALDDEDPEVRDAGLQGLLTRAEWDHGDRAALGRTAVVDAVRERLTDPQPILRFLAASWIAQVAPTYDLEALSVWIRLLDEGHVDDETLSVLTRLGSKAESAVPALERALERTTWAPGRAQIMATIDAIRGR